MVFTTIIGSFPSWPDWRWSFCGAHLSGVEAGCCPFTVPPENKICLQCHVDFKDNDKRVALSNHPLVQRFPVHQSHEALDLKCTDCHAQMIHGSLYKSVPVPAENCRNCHEERGVLNPQGVLSKLFESTGELHSLSTRVALSR